MRGLRHIKTACGNRCSIPPDSSPYSMRSHVRVRQQQAQPKSSSYKPRSQPRSQPRSTLLGVQKNCELVPELIQRQDGVDVCISLPPAAMRVAQLDVQGGILIVEAVVEDIRYYTECLLPFEADLVGHLYNDGILRINLKAKES